MKQEFNKECICQHKWKEMLQLKPEEETIDDGNGIIKKYIVKFYYCGKCGLMKARKFSH